MSFQEDVAMMRSISNLLIKTNCYIMVFDGIFQIADGDIDESYDFDSPEHALQYLENKQEYLEKQFLLINEKGIDKL